MRDLLWETLEVTAAGESHVSGQMVINQIVVYYRRLGGRWESQNYLEKRGELG